MRTNVFRQGRVHVMAEKCPTCIFRPGNLMHLQRGRVRGMLEACEGTEGVIPCHETLHRRPRREAICRGFYEQQPGPLLQVAQRLGIVQEVKL